MAEQEPVYRLTFGQLCDLVGFAFDSQPPYPGVIVNNWATARRVTPEPQPDAVTAAAERLSPTVRWWARDYSAAWVAHRRTQYAAMQPDAIRRSLQLGVDCAVGDYAALIRATVQDAFDAEARRLLDAAPDGAPASEEQAL